ncbi:hypothetical protein AVEN_161220-1 [Araneus ventricosus]|uniref:Uncharacterized protein n=1 Tax=Araneus ventricosus TaxID=182803 RepID=A0A4Y1ZU52_ARAVE|nr:hypothetical protein AVEN_161220-1 [Araneus ventricosus]
MGIKRRHFHSQLHSLDKLQPANIFLHQPTVTQAAITQFKLVYPRETGMNSIKMSADALWKSKFSELEVKNGIMKYQINTMEKKLDSLQMDLSNIQLENMKLKRMIGN